MLVRLLYVSRAADGLSAAMIDEIVAQSRKNNPEAGLTGLLCHSGSIFMQVIEGGRPAVSATFARILRDPRESVHEKIAAILWDSPDVDAMCANLEQLAAATPAPSDDEAGEVAVAHG